MKTANCFDDVLLIPQFSDINSRAEVNISSELDKNNKFGLPVISSPMDTITESAMSIVMARHGGLGVIHRYNTIQEQTSIITESLYEDQGIKIAAAVGVTDFRDRANSLISAGARIICIDSAHGHHVLMERCLKTLKDRYGDDVHLMAGNVATLDGFDTLACWGADSVRVGIGGGSICSTRLVTGHGLPTLQSILDCSRTTHDVKIVADGGIKTTGDMVKAYAAGADFVMVGSMLAGTKQTPGEVFLGKANKKYKVYRGMASSAAQNAWRGKTSTPEGISTTVPFRGDVKTILQDIAGGIRSGLSYSGAHNLAELRNKASFILQSNAAQLESRTHILWKNK